MAKRLVIFDCDGVLFQSERANVAFYNEVLRRLGEPAMDVPGEAACPRTRVVSALRKFVRRSSGANRSGAIGRAGTGLWTLLCVDVTAAGSLRRSSVASRDYRLAMATNRGKTAAEVVRRFALDRSIELTVGVSTSHAQTASRHARACLSHFGFEPEVALYVGDQRSMPMRHLQPAFLSSLWERR